MTAVLFVTSLSEYDQSLMEDATVKRMDESIRLFDEILNSKWFVESTVILFLNKSDIFAAKLKKRSLKLCFEDYKGK